jgi:hypothetical protein
MKCSNCGAKGFVYVWEIKLCADGRRRRVFRLCPGCDVALNAHMLSVMGDSKRKEKIERYQEKVYADR